MTKSITGIPKGGFATDFERELRSARVKAGKVVGPKVVKERIDGLKQRNAERLGGGIRTSRGKGVNKGGQLSRPRRSNVKARYDNKDGLLVALDLYPYAMEHEEGATLTPKTKRFLFIQDKRRKARPGDVTFVTKKGLVFAVKPWRKKKRKGGPPLKNTGNKRPRLIGVLKKKITIKPIRKEAALRGIADKMVVYEIP